MFLGIILVLIGLASIAIPVLIIVAIVNATNKKKEGEKSDSFPKIIRTVYLYIMLIIFLCVIIGSVLGSVEFALDLFLPEEEFGKYVEDLNDKNELVVSLFTSIAAFVVALPMFIYHNSLIKKIKEEK